MKTKSEIMNEARMLDSVSQKIDGRNKKPENYDANES